METIERKDTLPENDPQPEVEDAMNMDLYTCQLNKAQLPLWIVTVRHQYKTTTHRVRAETAGEARDIAIQRRFGRRRCLLPVAPNVPNVGYVYKSTRMPRSNEWVLLLDQDGTVHTWTKRA